MKGKSNVGILGCLSPQSDLELLPATKIVLCGLGFRKRENDERLGLVN